MRQTSRRAFLASVGALGAAAAVARVAKRLPAPRRHVLHADGVTDDVEALDAWGRGEAVYLASGVAVGSVLSGLRLFSSGPIRIERDGLVVDGCRIETTADCGFSVGDVRNVRITNCFLKARRSLSAIVGTKPAEPGFAA